VQAYLDAEVEYILASLKPGARVLELGCGYGRVLAEVARQNGWVVGIDLSLSSLALARHTLLDRPGVALAQMNVAALSFHPGTFDLVCCPQNGISAFHVDKRALIASALRLVAAGGKAQFFSYADAFWPHRLAWFRIQAAEGLVGEIDESATGDGTIVCKDGFTASTVSPDRFLELTRGLGTSVSVSVLEHSSVVCTLDL
jgi:SAM-dependent methyltransferase